MRFPTTILVFFVLLGSLGGCAGLGGRGQVDSTPAAQEREARDRAIESARRTFEQAKAAGGEHAAPFHYYLAEEYLRLAVHEAHEGDQTDVVGFAEQSAAQSEQAIRAAGRDEE